MTILSKEIRDVLREGQDENLLDEKPQRKLRRRRKKKEPGVPLGETLYLDAMYEIGITLDKMEFTKNEILEIHGFKSDPERFDRLGNSIPDRFGSKLYYPTFIGKYMEYEVLNLTKHGPSAKNRVDFLQAEYKLKSRKFDAV